jgi:hypothetical protein
VAQKHGTFTFWNILQRINSNLNTTTLLLLSLSKYTRVSTFRLLPSVWMLWAPAWFLVVLVSNSGNSAAQLYQLNYSDLSSKKGLVHMHEIVFGNFPKKLSPPGSIVHTNRVKAVQFQPTSASPAVTDSPSVVLGTLMDCVYLYDIVAQKLVHSQNVILANIVKRICHYNRSI